MNFLAVLFVGLSAMSYANTANNFTNNLLELRYNDLTREIRCPVCQGQSIADSDAPLANDLRNIVAMMLKDGRSDSEIIKFMTDRYGVFASFKPPVNYQTYFLWGAPFVFIIIAFLTVVKKSKNMKAKIDN